MVEDQVIQTCSQILICLKFIFFLFLLVDAREINAQKNILNKSPQYNATLTAGNILSWSFAEKQKDFKKIKDIINKTKENLTDLTSLKKAFFSSLIIGDWEQSLYFAKKINLIEPENLFVNLVISSEYFLNEKYELARLQVKKIKNSDFVNNYNEIIIVWMNLSEDQNKVISNFLETRECIPIKCLHQALITKVFTNNIEARKKFDNLMITGMESLRLSEILIEFYNAINEESIVKKIIIDIGDNFADFNKIEINTKNFDSIINSSNGLAELYFNIAGWFYEKNMLEFAAYFSNISLKLRPNFKAQKILLASIYEKFNLNELALDSLKGINDANLYYLKSEKLKVQIFNKTQNNIELLNTLEKLVITFPKNQDLKILLGKSLHNQKRYSEAINYYTFVINHNLKTIDNNWDLYFSRGMSFERSKKWKEAEQDLIKALEINPQSAYVLNYLGYSWLERGINFEKALEYVTLASEILPDDGYIIDSLGWAYFLLGDYEKAIKILEYALKILPMDPTLNDHLGDAYWKVGRKEEALSQWKRVLIFKSDYEYKDNIDKKIISGL